MGGLDNRILGPDATVQFVPSGLGTQPSPLLEKEGHAGFDALVAQLPGPRGLHRAKARATLAANDDPMDALEIYFPEGFQERFYRDESDRGIGLAQVIDPAKGSSIFKRNAEPDV